MLAGLPSSCCDLSNHKVFVFLDFRIVFLFATVAVQRRHLADVTQAMAVETEDEQSGDDLTPSVDLLEIAGPVTAIRWVIRNAA